MKSLICTTIVTFAIHSIANAACGLYEQPNGMGPAIKLENNTANHDFRNIMISRRSWHGHLSGWHGRDRSFNDEVTSVAVDENCTLELFENVGYQGSLKSFPNGTYNLMGIFDNIPSSAVCRCGGEVQNSAPVADAQNSNVVMPALWGR
jgi:hypothetical protein